MTPAAARKYCASLKGATYDLKWGADHVYSVGGKMFAVVGDPSHKEAGLGFKVDDHRFLELTDRKGIIPAPYLARAKWVLVQDYKSLADADLKTLIARSRELIVAKLPKKLQLELKGSG